VQWRALPLLGGGLSGGGEKGADVSPQPVGPAGGITAGRRRCCPRDISRGPCGPWSTSSIKTYNTNPSAQCLLAGTWRVGSKFAVKLLEVVLVPNAKTGVFASTHPGATGN
jgi:hypothetical protein